MNYLRSSLLTLFFVVGLLTGCRSTTTNSTNQTQTSSETIAQEIGGQVLLITPLAPDWSNNLLQISQTFAEVLQKEGNRN